MPGAAALPHLLVVDDDTRLRSLLARYLGEQGHLVTTAASAADARRILRTLTFDLVVLDVMMPGENGLDFARSLRAEGSALPVLMLTAQGEPEQRIAGLEAGADDYLAKPFEPRELVLRIGSILRRAAKPMETTVQQLKLGRWRLDVERMELSAGAEILRLTDVEAGLLKVLAQSPGVIVSREDLADQSRLPINERSIDVQVNRLRRKIETDPKMPRYLQTVRGAGYVLRPD